MLINDFSTAANSGGWDILFLNDSKGWSICYCPSNKCEVIYVTTQRSSLPRYFKTILTAHKLLKESGFNGKVSFYIDNQTTLF